MADAPTLPTYRTDGVRFDELVDERGRPREHWRRLVQVFDRLGAAELDDRRRLADRLLSTEGASYVVHDDGRDDSRPWQIDPVPLLWPERDWATLESGLAQRTRLLEALLADLYGPQRLLREGVVPAEVVFASSGFRWPCVGWSPTAGPRLTVAAADVVREASGRLVVLRDHTDAPGARATRWSTARCSAGCSPMSTASFASRGCRAGSTTCGRRSPAWPQPTDRARGPWSSRRESVTRATSSTPTSPATSGITWWKDPTWRCAAGGPGSGPSPAWSPSTSCCAVWTTATPTPSSCGGPGPGGIPGLVQASREGGIGVANALGSGLAGDVALQAYLPAACEALLDERLLLSSPRTLWLGDARQRGEALSDLPTMVLHELGPNGVTSVFVDGLAASERADLLGAIEQHPGRYVAQARLELATAPVMRGDAIGPGTVVVRTMVVATRSPSGDAGWSVLPGGLGRVVREDQPVLVQRRGTAKDVWVVAGDRSRPASTWSARASAVPQVDLRTSLPSRAAEALFWVGRNTERAEAASRLALALVQQFEQSPELAELAGGAWLTRSLAGLRAVSGGAPADVPAEGVPAEAVAVPSPHGTSAPAEGSALDILRHELAAALGDRPGGLADSLSHLAVSAGSVREFLSTSTWRVVGTLDAGRQVLSADAAKADLFLVAESLHDVVLSLMAMAGLSGESVVRGPGWRFLDLGRRVERALKLLGLIEAMVVPAIPPAAVEPVYETLLTACESLVAYRRRYRSDVELDALCDLLLADDTNPRAMAFQLDRITEDLVFLPDRRELLEQRELAGAAYRTVLGSAWLDGGRLDGGRLGAGLPDLGLHKLVLDARGNLLALVASLVSTWFTHAGPVRVVGGP